MAPLAATCAGEGPTVVVLHGFTQTAASMAPLVDRLAATRRVVALDLPGHGGSVDVSADLEESAALVAAAAGDGDFDLVGYSLGGRIALHVVCGPTTSLRRAAVISASPASRIPTRGGGGSRRTRRSQRGSWRTATWTRSWHGGCAIRCSPRCPRHSRTSRVGGPTPPAGLADSLLRCSVGSQRWLGDELAALERPLLMLERRP